ncbi:TIGR04282 family arsenosugar biosynthesis glycosyltransferase [Chitinophaga sp. XS-30]|uniref:TIGR04282 family arsenosugar biosynthesis glycosyltransferase n=1 Tax=Chitinophaga sp. XS-30 TaxID=2604421 RepID=UPI0011DE4B7A|nr:TIGR04282 family arsenosugar biosynthesis glycosyltransferase [Chitinophaga sp. XS-30]QEH42521.1 glycosyltransferase [Chitinophaga sp. XS-30]
MHKKALIIFVRHPVLGRVKTRIAATLGEETALAVYRELLVHTAAITRPVQADKFVFYADGTQENDLWDAAVYQKRAQADGDLGERMQQAFRELFAAGYQHIAIIGSDCFALGTAVIDTAFSSLQSSRVVAGPSTDGGYYLLGMRAFAPSLFENKRWSTGSVMSDTLQSVQALGWDYTLLPTLSDVDEATDIPAELRKKLLL